ncbi:hypothetical protein MTO96_036081 [Rhipicephalus appendiculatus]
MRCCVPSGTSSERRKEPGVTFHDLPYDSAARLHFEASDFRDYCKRRLVKPDAVPSVQCPGAAHGQMRNSGETGESSNLKSKRDPSPSVSGVPLCGDVQDDGTGGRKHSNSFN